MTREEALQVLRGAVAAARTRESMGLAPLFGEPSADRIEEAVTMLSQLDPGRCERVQ